MDLSPNEQEEYHTAKKRVMLLKSFYIHAFVYFMVNIFLFIVDMLDDSSNFWFFWPLLGWGIGLAAHGLTVFFSGGLFSKDWEDRKIREYMEKDNRKR
ncbi:2TM domain-containing protein [Peribacillus glennii]|uniref:Histidine kinase n=1 Tax=Peribacillus glennii TaxID=2303991 RepID=A0A372LFD8_9BACI|nr:2TM domain-containing protein [Peribacillus glennii]RFU64789.1 histidine kinase [Peribacillus glennii]